MAKSTPQTSEAAVTPVSATASTARITKSRPQESRDGRLTRQRSRVLALATAELNAAVDCCDREQLAAVAEFCRGKGKGKAVDVGNEDEDMDEGLDEGISSWEVVEPEGRPITDTVSKPFPIMELPTEIRLEIYRACLTRPYNILLSKREQPLPLREVGEGHSSGSGDSSRGLGSDDDERHADHTSATPSPHRTHSGTRSTSTRTTRPSRSASSLSQSATSSAGAGTTNVVPVVRPARSSRASRRVPFEARNRFVSQPEPERKQTQDPLITNVLYASKEIYKEARSVLYSENHFVLDLNTAMQTLGHLHQRSRRQIKHIELEIPTYNEILERFQETVRLSLRYCSGLKKFIIHMPFTLPGADGSGTTGNTTVYANGFDILRWLPQECDIIMEGNICSEIELVISKHLRLAQTLDKLAYARRQLISNETSSSSAT